MKGPYEPRAAEAFPRPCEPVRAVGASGAGAGGGVSGGPLVVSQRRSFGPVKDIHTGFQVATSTICVRYMKGPYEPRAAEAFPRSCEPVRAVGAAGAGAGGGVSRGPLVVSQRRSFGPVKDIHTGFQVAYSK